MSGLKVFHMLHPVCKYEVIWQTNVLLHTYLSSLSVQKWLFVHKPGDIIGCLYMSNIAIARYNYVTQNGLYFIQSCHWSILPVAVIQNHFLWHVAVPGFWEFYHCYLSMASLLKWEEFKSGSYLFIIFWE